MVDMQTAIVQQMNSQAAPVNAPSAGKKMDGSAKSSATPLFSQLMKDAQGKTDTVETDKDAAKEDDVLSMLIATAAAMPAALQVKSSVIAQPNSSVAETVVELNVAGQTGLVLADGQGNSVNGKNTLTNLTVPVGTPATEAADQNAAVQQLQTSEVAAGFTAKLATALQQDQTMQADATLSGAEKKASATQLLVQQDKLLIAQQTMQEVQQQAQGDPASEIKLTTAVAAEAAKPLETAVPAVAAVLQGKVVEVKSATTEPQDETAVKPETEVKAGTINAVTQQAGAQQQNSTNGETAQQDAAMTAKQDSVESATVQVKPQEAAIPFASLLHQHDKAIQPVAMTQVQATPLQTTSSDPYQVVGQIVDHAKLLSTKDSNEMVIRLNPEHLGEMTLRVTVANGTVNASFHTDNPEVRRLLESSMMQLRQDLFNQGFKVDNVDIYAGLGHSLPEGQQQGQGGQPQDTARQQRQPQTEQSFIDSMDELKQELNAADGVDYLI